MIDGETIELKMIYSQGKDKYKAPVKLTKENGRIWLTFAYNKTLMNDLKSCMSGMKWHGYDETPRKQWSIADNLHNWFQINFLCGGNPYVNYDIPLIEFTPKRKGVMKHQIEIAAHAITRKYCIVAGEMGCGKTLATIEALEYINPESVLWVGPNAALYSVQLEFEKWGSPIRPEFVPYSQLYKLATNWPKGKKAYQVIVFDESQRLKTYTAKRSEGGVHYADSTRDEWGDNGYVWLLTGSPAPKSPLDWYSQAEIACPGFLKEGDIHKFKERLAIVRQKESPQGGTYPELLAWRSDDKICEICAKPAEHPDHDSIHELETWYHQFKPCVNEVKNLYERLKGLVLVKFKKDCLDLPPKVYKEIQCPVSQSYDRAAKLISARSPTAIKALTLLRELSDGFQYEEEIIGKEQCPLCNGDKFKLLPNFYGSEEQDPIDFPMHEYSDMWKIEKQPCPQCDGSGSINAYRRTTKNIPCPKEDALREQLEEYSDFERIVIYGGFTGSVERCAATCMDMKWDVVKVAEGTWTNTLGLADKMDALRYFQDRKLCDRKIAFVAHPGAAGMGLNLTSSPAIIYYSNDFNGESRIQSEDRIHRPGMVGANIVDLFHLPSDRFVFDNLKKKRDLQSVSLGDLEKFMNNTERVV